MTLRIEVVTSVRKSLQGKVEGKEINPHNAMEWRGRISLASEIFMQIYRSLYKFTFRLDKWLCQEAPCGSLTIKKNDTSAFGECGM